MFIHKFAKLTVLCTFVLIIAGALVTSTGSGLSVPDWPLSYGQLFPKMEGGVKFEHTHRLIAGTVGMMTLILTILVWVKETRRWVQWLSTAALITVLLQAILGGITVLYGLPPAVSIFHAVLAQTFFCLMVSLAIFTAPPAKSEETEKPKMKQFFVLSLITTCAIFVQLILGASFRHGIGIQFLNLHIFNAVLISLTIITLFTKIFNAGKNFKPVFSSAVFLIALLLAQNLLGLTAWLPMVTNYFEKLAGIRVYVVSLHVATGALLLASSLRITLKTA